MSPLNYEALQKQQVPETSQGARVLKTALRNWVPLAFSAQSHDVVNMMYVWCGVLQAIQMAATSLDNARSQES